jgi:hypothetical protein
MSLTLAIATGAGAQAPAHHYDTNTVVTLKGTIAAVTTGPKGGRHFTLSTAQGTSEIALGPASYWDEHGFKLEKGKAIEVTGSKITMQGKPVVVAREVKKGDEVVVLRDKAGVPRWAGKGCGGGMPCK